MHAVIRINAEQAETTKASADAPVFREGHSRWGSRSEWENSPDGLRLLQRSISKILSAKQ